MAVGSSATRYACSESGEATELATTEQRVLVTFNVKDFARLATEWAAAGTAPTGILLVVGIDHAEFDRHRAALTARATRRSWTGRAPSGTRSTGA